MHEGQSGGQGVHRGQNGEQGAWRSQIGGRECGARVGGRVWDQSGGKGYRKPE